MLKKISFVLLFTITCFLSIFVFADVNNVEETKPILISQGERILKINLKDFQFTNETNEIDLKITLSSYENNAGGEQLITQAFTRQDYNMFASSENHMTNSDVDDLFYGASTSPGTGNVLTLIRHHTLNDYGDVNDETVIVGTIHDGDTLYQVRELPDGQVQIATKQEFEPELHIEINNFGRTTFDPTYDLSNVDKIDLPPTATRSDHLIDKSSFGNLHRRDAVYDNGDVIDVMVVYTKGAMCSAAGFGEGGNCDSSSNNKKTIESIITLAIEETNIAYAESKIQTRLRLVKLHFDAEFNDYAEWGSVLSALRRTNDGQLDYIHSLRDLYGADFVSMIVDTEGYCGMGYKPSVPRASYAFSITKWSCATGYYSFGHELAHNMGCNHNRENSGSGTYNFGYREPSQRFRTIMAYNCPNGCRRVNRFSNPDSRWNNRPTGDSQTNNARWITNHLEVYAKFRVTTQFEDGKNIPLPTLLNVGNNGEPSFAFPLGECQGDCDDDSECDENLYCFQRNAADGVPGCLGKGEIGVNYCYNAPPTTYPTMIPSENPSLPLTGIPTVTRSALPSVSPTTSPTSLPSEMPSSSPTSFPSTLPSASPTFQPSPFPSFPVPTAEQLPSSTSTSTLSIVSLSEVPTTHPTGMPTEDPTQTPSLKTTGSGSDTPTQSPVTLPPSKDISEMLAPTMTLSTLYLETTMAGGHMGGEGCMFDIVAKKKLTVTNFAVHSGAATTIAIQVWKRRAKGSFVIGSTTDMSQWELLGNTTLMASPPNTPTILPAGFMKSATIEEGQTQAFYVTFHSNTNYNRYTGGSRTGDVFTENEDFTLLVGIAKAFPFGFDWDARVFNGYVFYKTDFDGSSDPKATPSLPPSYIDIPSFVPSRTPSNGLSFEPSAVSPSSKPSSFHSSFPSLRLSSSPSSVFSSSPLVQPSVNPSENPSLTVAPSDIPVYSLQTLLVGGNGQAGNMFELQALTPLTVVSFDINTNSRFRERVMIFTKKGSFDGYENDRFRWEKISDTFVLGRGASNPTPIPRTEVEPVTIEAGEIQAFYITLTDGSMLRYTSGSGGASNSFVKFVRSIGNSFLFGEFYENRIWNGNIHFSVRSTADLPSSPPTLMPSTKPSLSPSRRPSNFPSLHPSTSPSLYPSSLPTLHPSSSLSEENATSTVPKKVPDVHTLQTSFDGSGSRAGNMFELKVSAYVNIISFDINTNSRSLERVMVFTKPGTILGHERDRFSSWRKICDTFVQGQGSSNPTPIPSSEVTPIAIEAGEIQSFYITLIEDKLHYSNSTTTNVVSDSNIYVQRSISNNFLFGEYQNDHMWNGNLHYMLGYRASTFSKNIPTTFDEHSTVSYGIMFDVEAKAKDIVITNLWVHTHHHDSMVNIEVYKLKSLNVSHNEKHGEPALWDLVGNATVIGEGTGSATKLPTESLLPMVIPRNSLQAIYVTIVGGGIRYTTRQGVEYENERDIKNEDLVIYEGSGVAAPRFSSYLFFNRTFNGALEYYLN